jgi:hypothetical protein
MKVHLHTDRNSSVCSLFGYSAGTSLQFPTKLILSNYHVQDVSANNSGSDLNSSYSEVFLLLWQVAEEP